MSLLDQRLLSVIVFLPMLVGGCTILLRRRSYSTMLGATGAAIVAMLSWYLVTQFDGSSSSAQFIESYAWLPEFGIRYILGVDGISLPLVVLTTTLSLIVMMPHAIDRSATGSASTQLGLLLLLEGTILGALLALDLVCFYIFWEVMLIPLFFIIGKFGGANRIHAATKFFIYTVCGSLALLAAAVCLYVYHFEIFGFPSTSMFDLYRLSVHNSMPQTWLFIAFTFAFCIKVPVWPLHTWLPLAHTEAPTAGSMVLAGVLLKMGLYGFLRFAIPLFPSAALEFAPVLKTLGIIGIVYGAMLAWRQSDAKKIVAFSSVSHVGFMIVALFSYVEGQLSEIAVTGAIYQMIAHGLSASALFFLVGVLYERRKSRELSAFGGLAKIMPTFALALLVSTLSAIGLPGTSGFVGELMILVGSFQSSYACGTLAATGVVLGAVYMLHLVRVTLFGPLNATVTQPLPDLRKREILVLAPLLLAMVGFGIYPDPVLRNSRAALKHLAVNSAGYNLPIKDSRSTNPDTSIRNPTDQEVANAE